MAYVLNPDGKTIVGYKVTFAVKGRQRIRVFRTERRASWFVNRLWGVSKPPVITPILRARCAS